MSKYSGYSDVTEKFRQFSDGVRVQMLIDRRNSNKATRGSRGWINKLISTNEREFNINVNMLLEQQKHLNSNYIRLYSSLNTRKFNSAVKKFQHKQLDIVSDEQRISFYTRIKDEFISSLMQPENRNSKLVLIDYDSKKGIDNILSNVDISTNYIYSYETPNGYHIITRPFNPSNVNHLLDIDCIKKDGLILLNCLPLPEKSIEEKMFDEIMNGFANDYVLKFRN